MAKVQSQKPAPPADIPQEPRRGFVAKLAAVGLGAAAYAAPVVAGVIASLNPLRQKGQAEAWVPLATLDDLPADGVPAKFPVVLDRNDAWNRFPHEPVGAVYVRRMGESVEAIQVVCPHAGCFVDYQAKDKKYFCPCHLASFDPSGKRLDATSASPRDLDTLEAEVREGGQVWVKFQTFRTGTPQKIVDA